MTQKYSKDAQQELMERSLTNVRALVDKIEKEEAARRNSQKWIIGSLVFVSVVLIGAVAYAVYSKGPAPKAVETSAPARPQPPAK